jgi:DNA-binding CsgD family transcriptional regulator
MEETHPAPRVAGERLPGWLALSDQEREIAVLTGQALTNRQIGSRLFLSPHTVNYHLRKIYEKLGLVSRVQLAALIRR